ncbi:MAG: ATP-binding protein [Anaerolineales bacterium]|jgi:serine/threonine-protein kinase RsbW
MPTRVFPGDFSSLAAISDFVIENAQKVGFTEKETYAVQLAVDEACANIIEHAYGGEGVGNIEMTINTSRRSIEVILKDTGDAFDPNEVPDLDISLPLDQLGERGAGVYLMHKLMDEVLFEFSKPKGTTLIMRKKK